MEVPPTGFEQGCCRSTMATYKRMTWSKHQCQSMSCATVQGKFMFVGALILCYSAFTCDCVCRSPFIFLLAILCSDKTELYDARQGIECVDEHVRPSAEALVLHTWYVDLWDEIGRACVGKECRSRWWPYH